MHVFYCAQNLILFAGNFVTGHVNRDQCWCEDSLYLVMERFPPSAEFDTAPGRAWPTVVELPVKSTHRLWHRPSKMFDPYLDAISLVQLRKISRAAKMREKPAFLKSELLILVGPD